MLADVPEWGNPKAPIARHKALLRMDGFKKQVFGA